MKFRIENMLMVTEGEITLEPRQITTIVGDNASGKTSIASLVGAVLARNENPFSVSKAHGKIYLHDKSDSGKIEQYDENDEPVCRWDAVSGALDVFEDEEETPVTSSSLGAVGLIEFCAGLSEPARVALWEGYFLPSVEILRDKLKTQLKKHLKKSALEDVLDLIDQGDLKRLVSAYETRRKKSKASWMGVTGQNWGTKQAADWIPEGWTAELDGLEQSDAENVFEVAKDELRNLQIRQTISVSDVQNAIQAKEKVEEIQTRGLQLKADIESLEDKIKEASKPLIDANKEFADTQDRMYRHNEKKPMESKSLTCGHCGESLMSTPDKNGVFPIYDDVAYTNEVGDWEDKQEELQSEIDHYVDFIKGQKQIVDPMTEEHYKMTNDIQQLRGECRSLIETSKNADKEADEVDHEAVQDAEKAIAQALKDVELIQKREQARSHHEDILAYNAIIHALGPKGVRSTMMKNAMDTFTAYVARIHEVTDWPLVELDSGYSVSIGGRKILRVCAESDRLRAQYTIQIAIALSQSEPVVILDMVDHLLPEHQEKLGTMLQMICRKSDAPAFLLCGATGHFQPQVLFGIARSYEVFDGVVTEVSVSD